MKSENVINLTSENWEEVIAKSTLQEGTNDTAKPIVIKFGAEWCGPCKVMGPILEEVAQELGESAIIADVNVDEESELSTKHGVRSIPAVFIYKDGEIAEKFVSVKQKAEIVEIVKKYI